MPPCLIKICKVIIILKFFPTGAGDFICLARFVSLMQEMLHAWRESGRNSVPLNAGELEALQKLKGEKMQFSNSICSINRLLSTFY